MTLTNYNKEAQSFLDTNSITVSIQYTGFRKYFADDKEERDTYNITFKRNDKTYSFDYGDSIVNSIVRKYNTYLDYVYAYNKDAKNKRFYDRKFITWKLSPSNFALVKKWPDLYSLLCGIASDSYDTGTLKDFCDSFWYDTDSRKSFDLYIKLQEANEKIKRFFSRDEITFMQDTFQ